MASIVAYAPIVLAVLFVVIGCVGCSSDMSDTRHSGQRTSDETALVYPDAQACVEGYVIRRAGLECSDVAGVQGHWSGAPSFPSPSAGTNAIVCNYRWTPTTGESPAEVAVLESLPGALVLGATCLSSAPPTVQASPRSSTILLGINGVHGCDVCVTRQEGELYVVFPPKMNLMGIAALETDSHQLVALKIARPENAMVVIAALPPDVDVTHLAPDPISLY